MVGAKNVSGGKMPESIVVNIPFSKSVASTSLSASHGAVQFDDATKTCKWTIGKLPRDGKNPILEGNVVLHVGASRPEQNPTLTCDFSCLLHSATGLRIDSLSCTEAYKPFKGLRCITKAGKLQIRS
jgi:AP-3 complex subunit mu